MYQREIVFALKIGTCLLLPAVLMAPLMIDWFAPLGAQVIRRALDDGLDSGDASATGTDGRGIPRPGDPDRDPRGLTTARAASEMEG
ncbi:hypothetical protein ACX80W_07530 [Arthrobacter sp. TMN-37]